MPSSAPEKSSVTALFSPIPMPENHAVEHSESVTQQLEGLELASDALSTRPTASGVLRRPTRPEQLAAFNRSSKPQQLDTISNVDWTNTDQNPDFLIGGQALMVNPSDPYDLHWPIRHGELNLHSGLGGSLSAVLQDLQDIWTTAISTHLHIQRADIQRYHAVLVIPDIYRRQHIRELTHLLLNSLSFNSLTLLQESVCGTFGAGVASACVIDVGDQKLSLSCVEDGVSIPATRLCLRVGGSDITRCLHWMLTSPSSFPYKQCDLGRRLDALLMQDLKETYCHLEQDVQDAEEHSILVRWPRQRVISYQIRLGDERILAPLSLFFPDMFGLRGQHLCATAAKYVSDPSDPLDEEYLIETMSKHEKAAKQRRKEIGGGGGGAASQEVSLGDYGGGGCDDDDDDQVDQAATRGMAGDRKGGGGGRRKMEEEEVEEEEEGKEDLMGLHQAICHSIENCDTEETRVRMYSCIVVVGGGLMFPGAQSWLQYLLWAQMSAQARLALQTMDVIVRPKDQDPRITCWKGAAVMSTLDTAQELWITRNEWNKYGVRLLRERLPFLW